MIPIDLAAELSAVSGRFGLIEDGEDAQDVVKEFERDLGTSRCSVGVTLSSLPEPPSSHGIEELLMPFPLLVDIEILFAPPLKLDPIALLRRLARRAGPRIALWPGALTAGRGTFSLAQREDHYDRRIDDVLILRPVPRAFPDEPCFEIERWLK